MMPFCQRVTVTGGMTLLVCGRTGRDCHLYVHIDIIKDELGSLETAAIHRRNSAG